MIETIQQHWGLVEHHVHGVLLSAALIGLFSLAEIKWPATGTTGWRRAFINILIGSIVSVFAFICTALIAWLGTLVWRDGLIGLVVPGWRGSGITGLAVSVLAYGVAWDFFQYWFHRWQHVSPALWPSHRVHHSDDLVGTTTALRRSILELVLIFLFILVPTVLVAGVDEAAAPIAFAIFYGWGFFNHANIRLSLGPLTPVLSGPQWHRIHHGVEPEYRDQNFAAYFPILDILFGTYRAPLRDEYPVTGVTDPVATAYPVSDCFFPTRRRGES